MSESIDLGRKSEYSEPISVGASSEPRTYYPEFTYSGEKSLELPDEGTMTIRFCRTREVEEKRNGKDWYQCTIEVKSIENVEGEDDDVQAPAKSGSESGDALDAIARQLVSLHNKLEETD